MFDDFSNPNSQPNPLYYNGTQNWQPPPINSNSVNNINTAPIAQVISSGFVLLSDLQNTLIANSGLFQQVGNALDSAGSTMSLCNNAPASIQARIMRQIQPGESCWDFYKRMVNITMQYPAINPDSQPTTAEQIISNGNNDIYTNPFPTGVPTNVNQNPGGATLLLMLFLAILPTIMNSVYSIILTPIKWVSNGLSSLWASLNSNILVNSSTLPAAIPTPATGNQSFGISGGVGAAVSLATTALGNVIVQAAIAAGPKLGVNVQQYDALITTSYIQQVARSSMQLTWPEAVMLLPQFLALLNQQTGAQNALNYYSSNGLAGQPNTPGSMLVPTQMSTVLNIQNNYINSGLTGIQNTLAQSVLDNTVCCLIKALGSLDTRALNTFLGILQLTMNRYALRAQSLDSILNNLWASIQKSILTTIMSIMYNLLAEAENSLIPILQTPSPAGINLCTSWNVFSTNLLQFIKEADQSALMLASELSNSLRFQNSYQTEYTNNLTNMGYIKIISNLITIIQGALNSGALCMNSTIPTNQEIQNLLNQLPSAMNITPEQAGGTAIAVTSPITIVASCLANVPASELAMVNSWIQALKGQ